LSDKTVDMSGEGMNLVQVYNNVSHWDTFANRAALGTKADLREVGDGWLVKSDKQGEVGVAWEYRVYEHMIGLDLPIVPDCDLGEGVFGYPDSILLRKIDNGATLRDYFAAFLDGLMPLELLVDLAKATSDILCEFWEAGYTHRDLHSRNIVVGLNSLGTGWQPYLIDFSTTTHGSQLEEYCYAYGLILAEMHDQANDWNFLSEDLWAMVEGIEPPDGFHLVMGALNSRLPF
jgi:tRNA A-37 threonylcarbamoyl transferase component Bud32